MTDVIEYARRFTLNMTNLNTAFQKKGRSTLYHIVENDDDSYDQMETMCLRVGSSSKHSAESHGFPLRVWVGYILANSISI